MRSRIVLLIFAVTYPFVVWGAISATGTFRNTLSQWPSKNSEARREYDQFESDFESADLLMVSWPGCFLDDPRLPRIENQLSAEPQQKFFARVVSGASISNTLQSEIGLSARTSASRIGNVLVGPDKRQTSLLLTLTSEGTRNRTAAFERLIKILKQNEVPIHDLRFAGPANDLHNIDLEGFWSPLRAVPMIGLLALLFTWMFVRQFSLAGFISVMSWHMGSLALTIVFVSGTELNALVWTMPTLVLLLTTSASLHFLAYYRDALSSGNSETAPRRALKKAWRPIAYCAITTTAGLFSLTLSETQPVRQFGFFGGISVLTSAIVVLSCLPSWLSIFPLPAQKAGASASWNLRWDALARFCRSYHRTIIVASCVIIAVFAVSVTRLKTGVAITDFFPPESPVIQDADWFEKNVGPLSSIEVVLTFKRSDPEHDVDRVKMLQWLDQEFCRLENVAGTISAGTYAPTWSKRKGGLKAAVERKGIEAKVKAIKRQLVSGGLISVSEDGQSEAWRLSVRLADHRNKDLEKLLQQIRQIVLDTFGRTQPSLFPAESLTVVCTGHAVIVEYVEQQFMQDLIVTYSSAVGLISLAILFIMRSFTAMGIATLPNLFPAVAVLGGVALLGIGLDVGSLLTASVALGIAVDDTLHFMLWWREKVRQGMSAHDAIVDAMQHCGLAMIQTTVACGVSVALYAYCGFLPTVRFGLLLSSMLFVAIVGDLILLPAILSSRVGRSFAAREAALAKEGVEGSGHAHNS